MCFTNCLNSTGFRKRLADHIRSIGDDVVEFETAVQSTVLNKTESDRQVAFSGIQNLDRTQQRLRDLAILFDHLSLDHPSETDLMNTLYLQETRDLFHGAKKHEPYRSGDVDLF